MGPSVVGDAAMILETRLTRDLGMTKGRIPMTVVLAELRPLSRTYRTLRYSR